MTKILEKGNLLVGSWVQFKGTFLGEISNIFNKYLCVSTGAKAIRWIWGPSIAFYNKDKEKIQNYFKETQRLSNELKLSRNPDDFWLAIFMRKEGKIEVINKTYVVAHEKENSSWKSFLRNIENHRDGNRIIKYLK